MFNTSKSNNHLWEQISCKIREKGFDRSLTMCTDKWRNLLKEFKKAKHYYRGSGSAKMSYCKEIDEILRERNKNSQYKTPTPAKVDSYMPFSDKGVGDTGISFGPVEGQRLILKDLLIMKDILLLSPLPIRLQEMAFLLGIGERLLTMVGRVSHVAEGSFK